MKINNIRKIDVSKEGKVKPVNSMAGPYSLQSRQSILPGLNRYSHR
jgi:hypothetical protein